MPDDEGKSKHTIQLPADHLDRLIDRIADAVVKRTEEERHITAIAEYVLARLAERGSSTGTGQDAATFQNDEEDAITGGDQQ